jgi:uncharacterized protein
MSSSDSSKSKKEGSKKTKEAENQKVIFIATGQSLRIPHAVVRQVWSTAYPI